MNPVNRSVPYVVSLPAGLARRVAEHVDDPATAYDDISEFASVAFRNQLSLETDGNGEGEEPSANQMRDRVDNALEPGDPLLGRLEGEPRGHDPIQPSGSLAFLTNRLNPFVVVARVAANLGTSTPGSYLQAVEPLAREVGLRLVDDDVRRHLKQAQRRATSWPVGENKRGSLDKFRDSYLIDLEGVGPAVDARVLTLTDDGLVACTPEGARLAAAACPFLEGPDDGTSLSREAVVALRDAVLGNREEAEAVRAFLDAVEATGGAQPQVDTKLAMAMPDWSEGQVTAHRAAMIGRLRDLDVVHVDGRGSKAVINIIENPLK